MTLLRLLGTIVVLLALIPATGIVLTYRRVDWRSTTLGRVMFSKSLAIAVVLWLSLIASLLQLFELGRPTWFELLRLVAFAFVAIMLWLQWRVYRGIVLDATRHARDDDERRDTLSS